MALEVTSALDKREPEIGGADIGLETMLLEEHPLQRFGTSDAVFRRKCRAARHVPKNGIGFREMAIRRDFEQRHLPVGILAEKFGRAAFALQDVDLDQLVRNSETGQREADLVTVTRALHRI